VQPRTALALLLVACSKADATPDLRGSGPTSPQVPASGSAAPAAPAASAASASASSPAVATAGAASAGAAASSGDFASWLRAHAPAGARVEGSPPKVFHTVAPGDTPLSIAKAYLDVTDVYLATDLAAEIGKRSLAPGTTVEIPHLVAEPYDEPEKGRLGWPADRALRGVFITGPYAAIAWVKTLDALAVRGLNAVVLDSKDYVGTVNYPTKAKIALETGAAKDAMIPDLARAIRFAHARGIRVILRIPCFHDPWTQKRLKRLSIMGNWGGPYNNGWIDPQNPEAQDYILELVGEGLDAGADEIQLDYVRFPVTGEGIESTKLPNPKNGDRFKLIRDFVRKVHEVTKARGVPLSLDLFGVTATGDREDKEKLGQDIAMLGAECEALSPMSYPSHYSRGWRGFDEPGNHPEVIGIATKAAVAQLEAAKNKTTVIRPWLQAFPLRARSYGPKYVADEAKQAESNGGVGWLMWSPGCEYGAVWAAFSPKDR
jgi:hypothetical protein